MQDQTPIEKDRRELRARFYRAFDLSRCEALLALSSEELNRRHAFLGSGRHFEAWHFRDLGLVIKRSHSGFHRADSASGRRWLEALRKARDVAPLWPPVEAFVTEKAFGLVMPFGEKIFGEVRSHWEPLTERLAQLRRNLQGLGLELADVTQVKAADGVPFVVDLSDLRACRPQLR